MHLSNAKSVLMAAAVSVAACAPGAATKTTAGSEADALHDRFIIRAGAYNSLEERKAMAACINWDLSTKDRLAVFHTQSYYEPKRERRGERGVTRSVNLMSLAIRDCKSTRKTSGADCKCQPMDRNGKSALNRNNCEPSAEWPKR